MPPFCGFTSPHITENGSTLAHYTAALPSSGDANLLLPDDLTADSEKTGDSVSFHTDFHSLSQLEQSVASNLTSCGDNDANMATNSTNPHVLHTQ